MAGEDMVAGADARGRSLDVDMCGNAVEMTDGDLSEMCRIRTGARIIRWRRAVPCRARPDWE